MADKSYPILITQINNKLDKIEGGVMFKEIDFLNNDETNKAVIDNNMFKNQFTISSDGYYYDDIDKAYKIMSSGIGLHNTSHKEKRIYLSYCKRCRRKKSISNKNITRWTVLFYYKPNRYTLD